MFTLPLDNQLQPPQATPTVPESAVPMGAGLSFDTTGKVPPGTLLTMAAAYTPPLAPPAGGGFAAAANPMTLKFDFSDSTQYGSPFGVSTLIQAWLYNGDAKRFQHKPDGTILGRYTNGQSQKLGQVTIANFAKPAGTASHG